MNNSFDLTQLGWDYFFEQQLKPGELESGEVVRVFSVHGKIVDFLSESGYRSITMPGSWKKLDDEVLPATGDWLLISNDGERIERVLDRKSVFKRKAAGHAAKVQLIAANIDTLFIVTSCNQDFNLSRLERYLALAIDSGAVPVLLLTKIDLCDDADSYLEQVQELRSDIETVLLNSKDMESTKQLSPWCGTGKTIALVGSSGVGKSTLINTLCTNADQKTADIREDDRGRHTTTRRSLHLLQDGGVLVDTPGMRELQLEGCDDGIRSLFQEIEDVSARCKFSNCAHIGEPGCAIAIALEKGEIDERRYANYQKMIAEHQINTESIAHRRNRDKTFSKLYRAAKTEKKSR